VHQDCVAGSALAQHVDGKKGHKLMRETDCPASIALIQRCSAACHFLIAK